MLKSKLLECNFWSRVDYHVEGKFLLLFSDVIQISLRSKRYQSSYSFFCSRLNFLDELARKRLLRRLHTD